MVQKEIGCDGIPQELGNLISIDVLGPHENQLQEAHLEHFGLLRGWGIFRDTSEHQGCNPNLKKKNIAGESTRVAIVVRKSKKQIRVATVAR